MTQDLRMLPIPPHVRDGAMEKAIRELPVEHRFNVRMAVRRAYAEGYDDGHRDGYREAGDDAYAEREQAAKQAEEMTRP